MCDHAVYTGDRLCPGRVDADNAGVSVRATKDLAVRHVWDGEIDAVLDGASDLFDRIFDGYALADDRKSLAGWRRQSLVRLRAIAQCRNVIRRGAHTDAPRRRSAAVMTARTMYG